MNVIIFGWWYIQSFIFKTKCGLLEGLVFMLNILRIFSFGSTSFIEEEHQSIYFFVITIFIAVFNINRSESSKKKEPMISDNIGKRMGILIIIVLCLLRVARTINQTGDK